MNCDYVGRTEVEMLVFAHLTKTTVYVFVQIQQIEINIRVTKYYETISISSDYNLLVTLVILSTHHQIFNKITAVCAELPTMCY